MRLKRVYNHDAPKKDWRKSEEQCTTCMGKGVVINDTLDGVKDCPDCNKGVRTVAVPPVAGVEVLSTGKQQNFSPNLVFIGQQEGWLSAEGVTLVLTGTNKKLTYRIKRVPGKYSDGTINHYDCELIKEEAING